jgi:predicted Zn-dependent protease with MMP-like domain
VGEVKPGETPEKPDTVVIYRRNATRGCADDDEVLEILGQALFLEAAEFLDLDDDALNEMIPDA